MPKGIIVMKDQITLKIFVKEACCSRLGCFIFLLVKDRASVVSSVCSSQWVGQASFDSCEERGPVLSMLISGLPCRISGQKPK